jgi:tetratricopeptide (TPR) repeat protein
MCLGNFPQLVRDWHALLSAEDLSALRPQPGRPVDSKELDAWTDRVAKGGDYPQLLLAAAANRLARRYDRAAELLDCRAPTSWKTVHANELASLAWHRGDAEHAASLWRSQPDSIPVVFNRGMAALFLGELAQAQVHFDAVVENLPAGSAWLHLGRLYRALAKLRR